MSSAGGREDVQQLVPQLAVEVLDVPVLRKRGDEAVLLARVLNVLGQPAAGGFGLTLWIALTTTRRASGIAGSRF